MILYFSATGNSRFCARLLAEQLGEEAVDAFSMLRSETSADLASERPWVFVCPTYSWQAPHVFTDWIRDGRFMGSRDVYFVMTCGGETGAACQSLAALCAEKGLTFRGLWPVVMPDNYIVMFPAPKPAAVEQALAAARPAMAQAAGYIRDGADFPPLHVGLADKLKSGPVNLGFTRYFARDKAFTVTDACIGCGQCAQVCVLGNIHLADGRPVWGGHCTHCMACISRCPAKAIEYGKATRGKARYCCPE